MQRLRSAMEHLGRFSDSDWDSFSRIWESHAVGRKVNLTEPGQIENYTYFVFEGIQRLYFVDEYGKEATIILTYESDFGGVLDSYLLQLPSKYYYETLSKSVFVRCKYSDYQRVLAACPNLKNIFDKGLYFAFSGTISRLTELQTLSSEDKFRRLLERSPHILHRIPHKYLASYIGIDATNFSKLINTIKI